MRTLERDELQSALRQARQIALRLDGSGMDRVLRMDTGRGLLEVQAATPWAELARYLASLKVDLEAFRCMPAAVGEALAERMLAAGAREILAGVR